MGPYRRVFWILIMRRDRVKIFCLLGRTFMTALTSCRSSGVKQVLGSLCSSSISCQWSSVTALESNSETSTSLPAWAKAVCATGLVQAGGTQNILEMGNYLNNHLQNQTVLRVFFSFPFLKHWLNWGDFLQSVNLINMQY